MVFRSRKADRQIVKKNVTKPIVILCIFLPARSGRFRIFYTNSIKSTLPRCLEQFLNFKKPSCPPLPQGLGHFLNIKNIMSHLLPRGLGHCLIIKKHRVPPPTTGFGTFFETFFGKLSTVIKSIVALPDLLGAAGRPAG